MSATIARVTTLSSEDRAHVERIEALARSGAAGVRALVESLTTPSWVVRRAVVAALAAAGEDAVPLLVDIVVSHRSHEARLAAAVDALVASRARVEGRMIALAASASPTPVVCDAVQVLGRRRARESVTLLAELSRSDDDNVAVAAIEALGRIGGAETVEALIDAVRDRHFFRTFPAIDALGRTGDSRAVAPLTALLDDPLYASEAIRALGRTGQLDAVPALAALLVKPSAVVRTAAVALSELRESHEARYGGKEAIAAALAAAVDPLVATPRLVETIPGAAASELVAIARVLGWLGDELAVTQLIELAMHDSPVGEAAANALRRLGSRAALPLLVAIRHGDSARRLRLLPIVGYSAGAIDHLLACLHDVDPDVRTRACDALARVGDPSAVGELFRLIGDRDARVSQAAAAAIQSLGSLDTKRLALEQARSEDSRARRAAMRILSYFGYPEGLEVLIEGLSDEDEKIRETAASGLPLVDDPRSTSALLEAGRHPSTKTRAAVIRALGHTSKTPPVVAALRSALSDPEPWVRYYACQSLGRLRVDEAADEIVALIRDGSGQVRVAAVEALAHLSSERSRAALTEAARAADPDIRRAALLGLGIARRAESIPLLRAAASDDDPATRLVAIGALSEFDSPDVVPVLAFAASDPDTSVRSAAIGYLSTRPGSDATTALLERLDDPNDHKRILDALAVAGDLRIDGVLSALESADPDRAALLVSALTRMRRPSADAAIASALVFENVHARRAAAAALAAMSSPEAHETLARAGAVDPDPEVRRISSTVTRH